MGHAVVGVEIDRSWHDPTLAQPANGFQILLSPLPGRPHRANCRVLNEKGKYLRCHCRYSKHSGRQSPAWRRNGNADFLPILLHSVLRKRPPVRPWGRNRRSQASPGARGSRGMMRAECRTAWMMNPVSGTDEPAVSERAASGLSPCSVWSGHRDHSRRD
jgi:hypothetical protein